VEDDEDTVSSIDDGGVITGDCEYADDRCVFGILQTWNRAQATRDRVNRLTCLFPGDGLHGVVCVVDKERVGGAVVHVVVIYLRYRERAIDGRNDKGGRGDGLGTRKGHDRVCKTASSIWGSYR
jgi:hypothetical protein